MHLYIQVDEYKLTNQDKITEHGLVLDKTGKTIAYAITNRGEQGNQYIYDKVVDAENIISEKRAEVYFKKL